MRDASVARHVDRIESAIAGSEAAHSALVASWQRSCALHRLDPADARGPQTLTGPELQRARERLDLLIRSAQDSLDRLYQAVGGVGCCVLLADADGVPVDRRGAPADDETFHRWGLWTGTVWSEASEGTNGIGTCLVEQRLLTIHRDQHFHARNSGLSCTTAPIHDHEGRLAAALDVSSCRADLTEGFVNLIAVAVSDAVRRIEAENFRRAFPDARVLLAPSPERGGGGLIAVDRHDLVIGATRAARLAFGLRDDDLRGSLPAADLLAGGPGGREQLADAERGVIQRALARSHGNVSAAAASLGMSRATFYRALKRLRLDAAH
ncbi:helix-turn-helix domain-containing protein [Chelatococcus sp. XZ-Ab1]|uniref:GAF domain-containing protein n=1 Tax=Chelatococcus sp. XZ-Ab1 TaxID=3034027 RepID=UPI0023E36F48|nr:helix-turn-helix domain-containing protein [Chelatococcus sp. XZ-Ab1]